MATENITENVGIRSPPRRTDAPIDDQHDGSKKARECVCILLLILMAAPAVGIIPPRISFKLGNTQVFGAIINFRLTQPVDWTHVQRSLTQRHVECLCEGKFPRFKIVALDDAGFTPDAIRAIEEFATKNRATMKKLSLEDMLEPSAPDREIELTYVLAVLPGKTSQTDVQLAFKAVNGTGMVGLKEIEVRFTREGGGSRNFSIGSPRGGRRGIPGMASGPASPKRDRASVPGRMRWKEGDVPAQPGAEGAAAGRSCSCGPETPQLPDPGALCGMVPEGGPARGRLCSQGSVLPGRAVGRDMDCLHPPPRGPEGSLGRHGEPGQKGRESCENIPRLSRVNWGPAVKKPGRVRDPWEQIRILDEQEPAIRPSSRLRHRLERPYLDDWRFGLSIRVLGWALVRVKRNLARRCRKRAGRKSRWRRIRGLLLQHMTEVHPEARLREQKRQTYPGRNGSADRLV